MKAILILFMLTMFGCTSVPVDPNAPPPTPEQIEAAQLEQQQNAINIANIVMVVLTAYIDTESDDWDEERIARYTFYLEEIDLALIAWQAFVDGGSLQDADIQKVLVEGLVKALRQRQREE
jgi:hypothetical protein